MSLKKHCLIAISFLLICASCNQDKKDEKLSGEKSNVEKKKKAEPAVTCDYFLTEGEGQEMVKKYRDRYIKEGAADEVTGLTKKFWMPKCLIDELDKFFKAKNIYDGIRIYWIVDDNENATLRILPTTKTIPETETYKHTSRWDAIFSNDEYPCIKSSSYFQYGRSQFQIRKEIFGKKYRQERISQGEIVADIPDLSSAVWVDSCVIAVLKKTLEKNTNSVAGIWACAGAYLRKDSNSAQRGQDYEFQSTLVFVPGKENGELKWNIIEKKAPVSGVANHGQLCPQICD
ncbi:MAG: hypothetical protein V9E88_09700 [Ferruginibacter sp.]